MSRAAAVTLSLFVLAPTRTTAAQLTNPGFETGDFTGWSSWGALSAINATSPIGGTYDARKSLDATETEAGVFQDDASVTTGRARSEITFVVESALDPDVTLRITVEADGTSEQVYHDYVIADASTPVGTVITGFVAGDLPVGATQTRIAVLLTDTSGAGGAGTVRIDDAALMIVPPGCGDRIVDVGENCDTGEKRSDTIGGACRLDCSGFVSPPGLDAGLESDAGPDAGTLTRDKGDCSIGHDASASMLPMLALVGLAVVVRARRAARRR